MEHETPIQEIFDEMKVTAIGIWLSKKSHPSYLEEKMDKINSIVNFSDNAMVFYRMFDGGNQRQFREMSSNAVIEYIAKDAFIILS